MDYGTKSLVLPRVQILRVKSSYFCGLTLSRQCPPLNVKITNSKNCGNFNAKPCDYIKSGREIGPGEKHIWVENVENTEIYSVSRVELVDILIGKEVVDVIGQTKSPEMDMCHAHCLPSSDENEIAGSQRDGNRAIRFVSQFPFQRAIGCFDRPRSQNLVPAGLAMPIGQS